MIKIRDIAIVLEIKNLNENEGIIKLLSKNHGLYSGIIKKKNSKNDYRPNIGDSVDFFWIARLSQHIGSCKVELIESHFARLMYSKMKLYSLKAITEIILKSFKERAPHQIFFEFVTEYLIKLQRDDFSILSHIDIELKLLKECGYGLDLSRCAANGSKEDLYYVSPKSAQAVSQKAGEKYHNKLLTLPSCLLTLQEPKTKQEVKDAKNLIEYFLYKNIINPLDRLHCRDHCYELLAEYIQKI